MIKHLINLYQLLKPLRTQFFLTLGIQPHSCRHTPSCSQYTKQAIASHGTIPGSLLAIKRLFSCNPFSNPNT